MARWDGGDESSRYQLEEEPPLAEQGPGNQGQTTGQVNDLTLRKMSRTLGPSKFLDLAVSLDQSSVDVQTFKSNHPSNVEDQIFHMLIAWRQRLPAGVSQTETLCTALESDLVGRQDLANQLRGTECSSSKRMKHISPDQAAADSCEGELKKHYKTTGSYVQMIPWVDDDKMHIMDIYTALQLETEGRAGRTLDSYEDIFSIKGREGHLIKIAVLNGLAGRGKSTLFDKMAYDWAVGYSLALKKYKLVLLLKMLALKQSSDLVDAIFDQLLAQDTGVEKGALESFIKKNPGRVLILLDGFDELMTTTLNESSFGSILKTLNRQVYRGCSVLVSTRPSHYDRLVKKQLVEQPFTHVRVLGFSAKDITQYVKKFYSDEHEKSTGLLERIQGSEVLSTLAESPMLLLLMCLLWRDSSTLPDTISRLYSEAVGYIFQRKSDVTQEEISKVVTEIGKVGLLGLLSPYQELSFKESDFEIGVLDMAIKSGILTRKRVLKGLHTHNSVQFIHKTFQEFCAAKFIQSLCAADSEEFKKMLHGIMSAGPHWFEYLLRFCCGDNQPCTDAIVKAFTERYEGHLSVESRVGKLALHCHFEGQSKCLPSKEFIHSYITDEIVIDGIDTDFFNSFAYFLKHVSDQTMDSDNYAYLVKVKKLEVLNCDFRRRVNMFALMNATTNLRCLTVSTSRGKRCEKYTDTRHCFDQTECPHLQHLQNLSLAFCTLNGQDIKHFAEAVPKLVELSLSGQKDLGGNAAVWSQRLKQLQRLLSLGLSDCSLNGQDIKHVAVAVPNLVELDLSQNRDLGGNVAVWFQHLKHLQHLQKLSLSQCSLKGQDIKHVAVLLSLVELDLSQNRDLGGNVALWSQHLKHLQNLEKLNLIGCLLDMDDFKHVAKALPDLDELDIW